MYNFLLITRPRSGAHFLTDFLANHPDLYWAANEGPDYSAIYNSSCILNLLKNNNSNKNVITKQNSYLEFFMNKGVKNYINNKPSKETGMTCHFYEIYKFKVFKQSNLTKAILLTRENMLEGFVSFEIKKIQSPSSYKNTITTSTIKCDFKQFIEYINHTKFLELKVKTFLIDTNIPILEIQYEELIKNTEIELLKIKKFLNLKSNFNYKSKFIKLEQRPLDKIIENWDEFSNLVKTSEYKRFLN